MAVREEELRFEFWGPHAITQVAGPALLDVVADDALQGFGDGDSGIFAVPEPDEPWDEFETSPYRLAPTPPASSNTTPPPPQPRRRYPALFTGGQDWDDRVEFTLPRKTLLDDVLASALMPSDEAVAAQAGDFECWALSAYLAIEKEHAFCVQHQQDRDNGQEVNMRPVGSSAML